MKPVKNHYVLPLEQLDEAIEFRQLNFTFKELVTAEELQSGYRLRYEIVVEKLAWVEGDPESRTEVDEFDQHSYHFGCFLDGKIVGYMRMTRETSPEGTMSKKYFQSLWQKEPSYAPEYTADISRLLVDIKALPNRKQLPAVLLGLYRLAYGRSHLCRPAIRYWYFITTPKLMMGLKWRMGLPLHSFGKGQTPDGKITYVAGLDLEQAKRRLLFIAPWRLSYLNKARKHLKPRLVN